MIKALIVYWLFSEQSPKFIKKIFHCNICIHVAFLFCEQSLKSFNSLFCEQRLNSIKKEICHDNIRIHVASLFCEQSPKSLSKILDFPFVSKVWNLLKDEIFHYNTDI